MPVQTIRALVLMKVRVRLRACVRVSLVDFWKKIKNKRTMSRGQKLRRTRLLAKSLE